jgi:phage tail sheath gpL-like
VSSTRHRFVRSFACAIALIASLALVACGDSDSEDSQELSYTIESKGKSVTVTAPETAEAGLAEITVANNGDTEADLQLIRVEGDRTPEEVVAGLGKAIQGQEFPEWFFAAGGLGTLGPGETATVEQVLQPGDYYAFNTEGGPPDAKAAAVTKVTGEESDAEIEEGDATVEAAEYVFNADTLPSGGVEIAFDNIGAQPHHLIASPIKGDATAEEVEKAFKEEKGPPPLEEKGTLSTAVLEGGEAQLVEMDLEPGRYALYCFITDRKGGPPHVFKGMVDEVEVE